MSLRDPMTLPRRWPIAMLMLSGLLVVGGCGDATANNHKSIDGRRFWAPYSEIVDIYDKFRTIPVSDRSLLDIALSLETTGVSLPARGLEFSLVPAAGAARFGADAAGYMAFPYSEALKLRNPAIYVNLPSQNRVIITIVGRYAGDLTKPVTGRNLATFVGQSRRAIERQAGIWSFFMPTPEGIRLRAGAAPGRVLVRYSNGKVTEKTLDGKDDDIIIAEADLGERVSMITIDRNVIIESYSKLPVSVTVDSEST